MHDGPEKLSDVLAQLFVSRGWGRKTDVLRLEQAWAETVGEAEATQTRVSRIIRGTLEVEVRSSILMQELAQFRKRTLLVTLREKLPNVTITDIRFRSGAW